MKTFKLLILSIALPTILTVGATSLAQTADLASPAAGPVLGQPALQTRYAPFRWLDPQLPQRHDIDGFDQDLVVKSSFKPSTSFVTLRFPKVEVTFFPEIAAQLMPLINNQTIATSAAERGRLCPAHTAFVGASALPMATLGANCAGVKNSVMQILAKLDNGCMTTRYPELTFKNYKQGPIQEKEMQDIEGLINMAGEAFYHVDAPAEWTTEPFLNPIRKVLGRLKFPALNKALTDNQNLYTQTLTALKASPTCDANHELARLISELKSESQATQADLAKNDSEGRAQAIADRAAVLKRGLQREVLKYPNLSDADRKLISTLLGGIYWRIRGGGLRFQPDGTNAARYLFNKLPMGAIGFLNGGDVGKEAGERQNIELILHGWGKYMTMGTTPGGFDLWYSFVKMTQRGAIQVDSASDSLLENGYDPYEYQAGGRQMGLCYFAAYQSALRDFRVNPVMDPPYRGFVDSGTPGGELCTGAAISLGLAESLLKGHSAQ